MAVNKRLILCGIVMSALAGPSWADVVLDFVEGAPKDRFVLTNEGMCTLNAPRIAIDLSGSAAGLVFDTTASGAGVEVFQPFEVVAGAELLVASTPVSDGDQRIVLDLNTLANGQSFAFTIDVDDTAGSREITVSQSEISGATVAVQTGGSTYAGTFDNGPSARVVIDNCTS